MALLFLAVACDEARDSNSGTPPKPIADTGVASSDVDAGPVGNDSGTTDASEDAGTADSGVTTIPDSGLPPSGRLVGAACTQGSECAAGDCLTGTQLWWDAPFDSGYCTALGCSAQSPCPTGSDCFIIDDQDNTACLASCASGPECGRSGYECFEPGACLPDTTEPPCTAGSCAAPLVCDTTSGRCTIDVGTPPPGPVPACPGAPDWECTGGEANCGQIVPFAPDLGPGYWDYPINGETNANQYRSYVRRDVLMMVQYAAFMVDCLGAGWTSFGNQEPLGLGDMSEANGDIPGTSVGSPGHPAGTHTDGRDMDIGYYQLTSPDNRLREICPHTQGGQEQYHCVAPPDELDVWRTALFLGLLHDNPQLRVIGVDGQAGPMIDAAIDQLCANGWLSTPACTSNGYAITYETVDMGYGWFLFHHHHFHISFSDTNGNLGLPQGRDACLAPSCAPVVHDLDVARSIRRVGSIKVLP